MTAAPLQRFPLLSYFSPRDFTRRVLQLLHLALNNIEHPEESALQVFIATRIHGLFYKVELAGLFRTL